MTLVNHINSKIQHRFAIIIFLTSRFGSTTSKARKDWPSLKETCYYCCATRLWYCNFLEKSTNQQMRYFLLDIDNIKLCLDTYEYEKESFFKFLVKRSKNVYWLSFYKSSYTKKAKSTKMCLLKQQMSLVIRNSFFAVQTRAFWSGIKSFDGLHSITFTLFNWILLRRSVRVQLFLICTVFHIISTSFSDLYI